MGGHSGLDFGFVDVEIRVHVLDVVVFFSKR